MSQTNGGVNKIPRRKQLLVLNVGTGIEVKLALRMPNNEPEFNSFHEVLDIMLHDLCHNAHGPYNASFYKFYDQFRKVQKQLSISHANARAYARVKCSATLSYNFRCVYLNQS
ncbi:hypothetical protein vseg_001807 [Gypsophila vaccaria]